MPEESNNKKIYIIVVVIIIALIGVGSVWFFTRGGDITNIIGNKEKPMVIEETLIIPDTQKINATESRLVSDGAVDVALVPKSEGEKVVVSKAVLTVKSSYALAAADATKWSSDALPVFVKSLGAVTLEGKSSQWQVVFSSKSKKTKGYEIIIQEDRIVSKKEVDSSAVGAELPSGLKDSGDAIKALQELPGFVNASISSISLFYNTDGKVWRYAFSTSQGGVSRATSALAE